MQPFTLEELQAHLGQVRLQEAQLAAHLDEHPDDWEAMPAAEGLYRLKSALEDLIAEAERPD
ncbi:MAG: hypothetical protein IT210_02600 [Armatimonadetes bacterium]|nr:hypothetical protein [Armatimonadota bacterium]